MRLPHPLRLLALVCLLLASCGGGQAPSGATPTPTQASPATSTPTRQPSPTETLPPSATPPPPPQTFVFYGDSLLKVGEGEFCFVDDLPLAASGNTVVVENHGGGMALWGSQNLEERVLAHDPDVVTLWFGANDLHGCTGTHDPATNALNESLMQYYITEHITAMQNMIDVLVAGGIPVFVLTEPRILGEMPWTHFDENLNLVWELDHRCVYNVAADALAAAQRQMVLENNTSGKPVHLVDVWQVYIDAGDVPGMYSDIFHPGSLSSRLIAEEWMEAYLASP